ncbi:MAG TPA: MgtC/SapB family protein [Azospira sp.]|nr:MgtC/SapB family protein [Azospira sp.]
MENTFLTETGLEFAQAFLLSLGVGLLMGLERERHPSSRAGLRTFALTALLGTICALLGERSGSPWVLAAGLLIVGAMMVAAYQSRPDNDDPGTTSVVALLLAYTFGAMIWHREQTLAVMLAILTTILLYFKAELHLLSQKLTRKDLISMLQFGVLSLVILPILPNQSFGPYETLNPYQVWWMVVLISGMSLAGYAALRIIGQQHGAPLIGLLGGLASSTATTLVYSRHVKASPNLLRLSMVVILTANLVVLVRLSLLAAMLQPALLPRLLPAMGGGLLLGLLAIAWAWRTLGRRAGQPEADLNLHNPAEIRTALTFGCIYAIVLLLSAWLSDIAGAQGLYAISLISGFTDVDAITLSSLRLFGMGKLSLAAAVNSIVIAFLANLAFKLGIVLSVAGPALGRRIGLGFLALALGTLGGWVYIQ